MKAKRDHNSIYNAMYIILRHEEANPFTCFYCGDPANTLDHQPPISRINDYRALGLGYEEYVKVPCCAECNGLLSNTLTTNLLARCEFLKDKLRKRYRHVLNVPRWTSSEIIASEVRGNIKKKIVRHSLDRRRIESRYGYSKGILFWLNAIKNDDDLEEPEA